MPEHGSRALDGGGPTRAREASGPTQLPPPSWWGSLKRTFKEFGEDNLSDLAAGLTYYAILALFPALFVLVSLLGLAGPAATESLLSNVSRVMPEDVSGLVTTIIENLQSNRTAAGFFGLVSLAVALWSASGYIAAFMRASNVVHDVPEGRPLWKTLPVRVAVTLVLVILATLTVFAVIATGGLAERGGELLGVGPTAVMVWDIAKWPVILIAVVFMIGLLYWASPNARRGLRWVGPGSLLAVVIWLIASGAFAVYVANFASYNETYGSMATVIIFLVWLWISNIAILLGAEFNAEIERARAADAGQSVSEEPYVELRDVPKKNKKKSREGSG